MDKKSQQQSSIINYFTNLVNLSTKWIFSGNKKASSSLKPSSYSLWNKQFHPFCTIFKTKQQINLESNHQINQWLRSSWKQFVAAKLWPPFISLLKTFLCIYFFDPQTRSEASRCFCSLSQCNQMRDWDLHHSALDCVFKDIFSLKHLL